MNILGRKVLCQISLWGRKEPRLWKQTAGFTSHLYPLWSEWLQCPTLPWLLPCKIRIIGRLNELTAAKCLQQYLGLGGAESGFISFLSNANYGPTVYLSRHFLPFGSKLDQAFASATYGSYEAEIIGSENSIFLADISVSLKICSRYNYF